MGGEAATLGCREHCRASETDMAVTTAAVVKPDIRSDARRRTARLAPEFPGCRPMPLKRDALSTCEGRFEYWDGDTETAWVAEPTTATHERPPHRLSGLVHVIAGVRGSPIECLGSMDLLLRDEHGERWRILQADQSVYLQPWRVRRLTQAMEIGRHDFPDVVLEVDHTTDVRRGKLGLYEAWGFPEVWVDVPESGYAVRRPAGLEPGLTIHLLEDGGYRRAGRSRAFPGWTAEEIHTALNEEWLSMETGEVLRRVARALGEREGTGPDDTPWLRMERRESRAEGQAEGCNEAGRTLLIRRTARRFGAETATRMAKLLPRLDAPEYLAEIDDWILDCATDAELLDRVEALGWRG